MSNWHMGVIKISKLGILRALKLEDHDAKYITVDNDTGLITIILDGPRMPPVLPGESLREVMPIYETQDDGSIILKEIQWQTPDDDSTTG